MFIHQLGYFYRDGTLPAWPLRRRLALTLGALMSLVVATSLDAYPRSLVAVDTAEISHMYPTTAIVALAAVFHVGIVKLLRPHARRWLRRRGPWKVVVAINTVILTLFVWHMTALLIAVAIFEGLGGRLIDEPTFRWWVQRPVWIILPAISLAVLVAVFARVETMRPPRRRNRRDPPETSIRTR